MTDETQTISERIQAKLDDMTRAVKDPVEALVIGSGSMASAGGSLTTRRKAIDMPAAAATVLFEPFFRNRDGLN